ncbi:TspO/MBR family protein [Streptomyces sp. NPDC006733]|uniref:TspO/MBR family protein n=1 Tax=Streptomyces sp. NPDC006733 TaxID=3155460 RepID=UPI0033F84688
MRLISERDRGSERGPAATYALTAAAVAAAAALGAWAVDADSAWYRELDKPAWQPPPEAFPAVWVPLYASIALAGGRALNRTHRYDRRRLAGSLAANLVLNSAWPWVFFRGRSPRAGVLATLLLDASTAQLIRRVARSDATAAASLAPYAAWCTFATALNVTIARGSAPGAAPAPPLAG